MLWFPFSVPATALGMLACLLFYLLNLACLPMVDGLESTSQAIGNFHLQLFSFFGTLRLLDYVPGGAGLFAIQLIATLLIWATIGLAICRCLAMRLCRDEYIGFREALAFGFSNFKTTALFPVIVFASVSILAAINFLIGSLMQIPYLGILFYLLLPVAFIVTALMLIISCTSILGAGMVSGAVAVEQRGTLDAWGKALNYIFARPLHVIIYMILMKVFLVDFVIGFAFENMILESWTQTSLSPIWDNARFDQILQGPGGLEGLDLLSSQVIRGVVAFVNLTIAGVVTSFAFAGTTAMFLILRRDVDGIDVADIKTES